MATIGLVVVTVGSDSALRTKALLESLGHTVTIVPWTTFVLADISAFDLVATCIAGNDATQSAVIKAFHDTGKPVIVGAGWSGPGSNDTNNPGKACGICDYIQQSGSQYRTFDYASRSALTVGITDVMGTPINGANYGSPLAWTFTDGSTSNLHTVPNSTLLTTGHKFGQLVDSSNIVGVAQKTGQTSLLGTPFPANIVFCGALFGSVGYSPQMTTLMRNVVAFALGQVKEIIGTVESPAATKVARRVALYNRATNAFVDKTDSDAITGNYRLVTYDTSLHFAVCEDADAGTKNALIRDRLTPVAFTG